MGISLKTISDGVHFLVILQAEMYSQDFKKTISVFQNLQNFRAHVDG